MDWKVYVVVGLMVLIGTVSNWEGLKEVFRELYIKRRGKKNGTTSESGQ
jgi:hypothetical protein